MNRPFADEYWKTAEEEISILEEIGYWDLVAHEDKIDNIIGLWVFKKAISKQNHLGI